MPINVFKKALINLFEEISCAKYFCLIDAVAINGKMP